MINTKLQNIIDTKAAIGNAINNKGGTITANTPFYNYAAQIDGIQVGGATKINFTNYATTNYAAGSFLTPPQTGRTDPEALSVARWSLSGGNIGEYYLFAGGYLNGGAATASNVVDAYNANFVRSTPTALSVNRASLKNAKVGVYTLFGGGEQSTTRYNTVDAYNTSLTRSTPTALATARTGLASATINDYALFAGGLINTSDFGHSNVVDAYNSSLTRSTPTALSQSRYNLASTTLNGQALFFAGRQGGSDIAYLDVYNATLSRTIANTVGTVNRSNLAGATVNNTAIFGGGRQGGSFFPRVDSFNATLVYTQLANLVAYENYVGLSMENAAIFLMGSDSSVRSQIYRYNNALTSSTISGQYSANLVGATSIGNSFMFAGGATNLSAGATATAAFRTYFDNLTYSFTALTIYARTITYNYALSINGSNQTGTINNGQIILSNQTFNGYLEFPSEI